MNKSIFTNANMLETMHRDTNANTYLMFFKLMHCNINFDADAPLRIGETYHA